MRLVDWYNATLLPAIIADPERGYGSLKLSGHGAWQRGPCPIHGGNDANFSFNRSTAKWKCHSQCGIGGDLVRYLAARDGVTTQPKGAVWTKYLKLAASLYGLELPADDFALTEAPKKKTRSRMPVRVAPSAVAVAKGDPDIIGDVAKYWATCAPLTHSSDLSLWLASRGLSGRMPDVMLERLDVVRASVRPRKGDYMGGYRDVAGRRHDWCDTMPAVFRMFDEHGVHRGFRWRKTAPLKAGDSFKAAGSSKGLVLADNWALEMLRGDNKLPHRVIIAEGETDWLTSVYNMWARRMTWTQPVACIGIVAGSWDALFANRIPTGSTVAILPDLDEAGARYEKQILATLAPRISAGELSYVTRDQIKTHAPFPERALGGSMTTTGEA